MESRSIHVYQNQRLRQRQWSMRYWHSITIFCDHQIQWLFTVFVSKNSPKTLSSILCFLSVCDRGSSVTSVKVLCWRDQVRSGKRETSHSLVLNIRLPSYAETGNWKKCEQYSIGCIRKQLKHFGWLPYVWMFFFNWKEHLNATTSISHWIHFSFQKILNVLAGKKTKVKSLHQGW